MDDLGSFIGKRLDEDEAMARPPAVVVAGEVDSGMVDGRTGAKLTAPVYGYAHDPARVLREVAAKRAIMAEHLRVGGSCRMCIEWPPEPWPCRTVRLLAATWSDHPDYRAGWAPGHG